MNKKRKTFVSIIVFIGILLWLHGCSIGKPPRTNPKDPKASNSTEQPPSVSGTAPADGATGIAVDTSISITFNEAMNASSISTNTADTSCSGSFQVSSDDFSTCVPMSQAPVSSNSATTFTLTPASNLAYSTIYKVRMTTAAADNGGNALASVYTDSNGFATVAKIWSLDTTFDSDGIVVHGNTAGGNGADEGSSIALNSSGKILVTGYSFNSSNNSDMVIWRYNADGNPDSTFGSGGLVVHDSAAGGSSYDEGSSIALDSSGKILVTGQSYNGSGNYDMVIWRYGWE